jgi:hypothetical protein
VNRVSMCAVICWCGDVGGCMLARGA